MINVKMPTIVGILTFISMINTTSERLKARNFFIHRLFFVYISSWNFVLRWVEHEKSFTTSGPGSKLFAKFISRWKKLLLARKGPRKSKSPEQLWLDHLAVDLQPHCQSPALHQVSSHSEYWNKYILTWTTLVGSSSCRLATTLPESSTAPGLFT